MLGIVIVRENGRLQSGVVPVFVEPPGRPVCVTDQRADTVIAYVERIGAAADLPARPWRRQSASLWMCS
jgi:poly-gamma-glutamate synthesis protein (capsule biosynthesis protein)